MSLHVLESAQAGRHVLLSERMVRDLRMLAIEGLVALPRRGIEIGGILFGEAHNSEIHLTAFEDVPCEHRYGPSYALSEADRANLKDLLEEHAGKQQPVAGFFRSFTSREPVIEAADEQFVRDHFPSGVFVCLMLQPLSAENCVATLRFFEDGELLPDTEEPPLVFDPRYTPIWEPPAKTTVIHPLVGQTVEEPLPPPPPLVAEPPPAPEPVRMEMPFPVGHERPRGLRPEMRLRQAAGAMWSLRWGVVAAICLLSLLGGVLAARLWIAARPARWTELHLDARPMGDRLEVTWDAAAPHSLDATTGLLAVTDGNTHREIPLDKEQVRSGKYVLTPAQHGDVGVRLIIYAQGRGAAGDAVRLAVVPAGTVNRASPPPGNADRSTRPPAKPASPPVRVAGAAVPPATVHEVQPKIPDGIRSRMTGEIVIPVEVQVDERGKVVRAVAKTRNVDSVSRYLSAQAQKAAREWRFTPARTGTGEQVAASKTLRFVFTP